MHITHNITSVRLKLYPTLLEISTKSLSIAISSRPTFYLCHCRVVL